MRATFLLFIVSFICYSVHAKTYYLSSSQGDDSRSSTQAQNPNTPWKSIAKLNSFFASLQPGDSVLFKRGDTFYGGIVISRSGAPFASIVFSSYGSGPRPVITGFTTLSGWKSKGKGIYESSNTLPISSINMLTLNGREQPMGRYPNADAPDKGYLSFESFSGRTSITDKELSSSPNWTGAQAVVRTNRWGIFKPFIAAHNGNTLKFVQTEMETPRVGFGYFFQNDIRTLDQLGEWYFNPSTKKMSVFFGSASPSSYTVQAGTVETLVYAFRQSFITFDGLSLQGSHDNIFDITSGSSFVIRNCEMTNAGFNAVNVRGTAIGFRLENSSIRNTNNNAVDISSPGAIIRGNTIRNTSLFEGLAESSGKSSIAITTRGDGHIIEDNNIDSVGHIAVRFTGANILVKNNVIQNFNLIKDDGGGVYAWKTQGLNRRIIGNIILNGTGAPAGTGKGGGSSSGIFIDDIVANVEIRDNTIANCSKAGIYVRNSYAITIRNNTLYDNGRQIEFRHDAVAAKSPLRNLNIKNNIFFSRTASQYISEISSIKNDIGNIGSLDNNYLCRPVDETLIKRTSYVNSSGNRVNGVWDLKGWQEAFSHDKNSKKTGLQLPSYTINSVNSVNKIPNGKFEKDISGLYGSKVISWVRSKLDGGTFQANVAPNSGTFQVVIAAGSVSSSKKYVLRFSAQSTKDTVMNVYLRKSSSPYTRLSDYMTFKVGPKRTEYEFVIFNPGSEANASIGFDTKGKNMKFWLDNIRLSEADVTKVDPLKLIRFEYNPTNTTKTVRLNARFFDVKNKSYSGSVTLAPYSSIILIKDPRSKPENENKSLSFEQSTQSVEVEEGGKKSFIESLTTSGAEVADIQLVARDNDGDVPAWLKLGGKQIKNIRSKTGAKLSFDVDASKLPVGEYTARVTASAADHEIAELDIQLTVTGKQSFSLKVNFQDEAARTPSGWLSDFGQAYGKRTAANQGEGNVYGWLTRADRSPLDMTVNGRNRKSPSEIQKATLMHLQAKGRTEGIWELKIPNGSYDVTVSSGDNSYTDSRHFINIEGVPAIVDFAPRSNVRYKIATVRVNVKDGRLTVDAIGGKNSKINYIIVQSTTGGVSAQTATTRMTTTLEEVATAVSVGEVSPMPEVEKTHTLSIEKLYPNPSSSHFNVAIKGNNTQPVSLYIFDFSGRIVESRTGITVNSVIQVGQRLLPGNYVLQIIQGPQKAETKLTKF